MAYGLDMTDQMLALALENQRHAGLENVAFLKGEIEAIPLPDASVDVIISNCVINLSVDKDRVLAEAWLVLKPGGRLAVSDVVRRRPVPEIRGRDIDLWVGCVAGALEESDYRARLTAVGFVEIDVEPTRSYQDADGGAAPGEGCCAPDASVAQTDGTYMSAFIRATRPRAASSPPWYAGG